MLNSVSIMGRLVRDPELRRTQSGIAVTTMRVAVDRDFKSQDGTKQADFFDVVAWRGTAEFASRYFFKGRMIVVAGRLQTREWTDRDGNKRTSVEIVADSLYFGDSKRDNPNNNGDFNPGYGSQGGYGGYGSAPGYGNSGGYGGSSGGYGGSSGGYGSAPGYGNSGGYGGSSNGFASPGGYGGYGNSSGGYASAPGYGTQSGGYGGYDNSAPSANPAPSGGEESGTQPPADTPSGSADPTPSGFAELAADDGDLPF